MPKLKTAVAVALFVAGMIATAVATANRDGASPSTAPTAASAAGPDSFSVFRRPAGPADQMPPATRNALAAATAAAGVNLDDARAVAASGTGAVWAIPGPQQACLAQPDPIDGFAVSCALIDQAAHGHLWTGLNGLPGQAAGDVQLAILVPDGVQTVTAVATDGTNHTTSVTDNVAFADLSNAQSVQFNDADGTETIPVAGTPQELVADK